jgi:hypothetical protein
MSNRRIKYRILRGRHDCGRVKSCLVTFRCNCGVVKRSALRLGGLLRASTPATLQTPTNYSHILRVSSVSLLWPDSRFSPPQPHHDAARSSSSS